MNYTTAMMLINESIRAVKCVYEPEPDDKNKTQPKRELFKTLDHSLKVGDYVVVPSTTRHKITTVKVVEVDAEVDFESPVQVEWIVGRIDMADYAMIKRIEDTAIERIKAAEKTRKKKELAEKMFEHDKALIEGLQIANLTDLPSLVGPGEPPPAPMGEKIPEAAPAAPGTTKVRDEDDLPI